MFIERHIISSVEENLENNSVVALLGPRQVGKTTLAQMIAQKKRDSLYLDLESFSDLVKLEDPLHFLSQHKNKLVIFDEIQRKPDLFMVLRGLVDKKRFSRKKEAQFLILGSASMNLLKQSSESLAGRISYVEMTQLHLLEVQRKDLRKEEKKEDNDSMNKTKENLWLLGGFPESYLAKDMATSFKWRKNFIKTYLERDIPQFGFRIPSERLRRLWTMLAHIQGQPLNASVLATNLDVNSKTIKYYIDTLADLFLVRYLRPWHSNVKKRMIKSPRVYIRDSGLLHCLLGISSYDDLLSHPVVGFSWEGFVIESILSVLPETAEAYFYKTSNGSEIDLILNLSSKDLWAIEIKKNSAPKISKGFHSGCEDIEATQKYIVYSGEDEFKTKHNTTVLSLSSLMKKLVEFEKKKNRMSL